MKQLLLICVSLFTLNTFAKAAVNSEDTLAGKTISVRVNYLERAPFFYTKNNQLTGIEKDILTEFVAWAEKEKQVKLNLEYNKHNQFTDFLKHVENESGESLGMGTITVDEKRAEKFHFSGPYLKNISVLITSGKVTDITAIPLKGAYTQNSVHASYIEQFAKKNGIQISPLLIANQTELPNKIVADSSVVGFMDVLNYWVFVKENPTVHLKIIRGENRLNESFGIVSPKASLTSKLLDEFFTSGFGFTSTKTYKAILEKYLGEEVISAVEVNHLQ